MANECEKKPTYMHVYVCSSLSLVKTNFVVWVYNVFESAGKAEKPLFNGFIYFTNPKLM